MLRDDRPISELLTRELLLHQRASGRHYGIPNIVGSRFRRVTMPEERAGLLGQGSILLVTSQANRTSPVLRGKFVLDNILGSPVPPPPPNVPPLQAGATTTARRSRFARRSRSIGRTRSAPIATPAWIRGASPSRPSTASAAMRWDDGGYEIDTASTLLDGTKLDGPAGVRKVLAELAAISSSTRVSEKLMVYALGRPVEYYDRPALRKIAQGGGRAREPVVVTSFSASSTVCRFNIRSKGAE